MAFDATAEADDIAKAETKGLGVPPSTREDQTYIKTSDADVLSLSDSDESIPSEEDLENLRRVPEALPWICFTVAFVELCERFAYYGTTAVREFSFICLSQSKISNDGTLNSNKIHRSRQFHPAQVA
jgi:POT family proton-dependent oligopeptide transporter